MRLFLESEAAPIVNPLTGKPTAPFSQWRRQITTAVQATNGILVGTHAERRIVDITVLPEGQLYYETDRNISYVLVVAGTSTSFIAAQAPTWVYYSGIMRTVLAMAPTDLGVDDTGFLLNVSDYDHLMRWTGATWEFAPGDGGSGYFMDFALVPASVVGWALCNGVQTSYLAVVGGNLGGVLFTPPNLVGTPSYRKSGAAYSGVITTGGGALTGGGAVDPSHITVLPYFRR